jgi:tRNA-splicing ligase RtcB
VIVAGFKLKSWASIIDQATLEQAQRTAVLPFVAPYVALMPDAHLGKGATVGSVIPTVGAILPGAIGVDIGCGMNAVRTQFRRTDLVDRGRPLSRLREAIEAAIPLSAGHYNERVSRAAEPRVNQLEQEAPRAYTATAGGRDWRLQLGSLGSGNHFIEVSVDEADRVWLFLHSGSRGIGNRIAQEHVRQAQRETGAEAGHPDLAYLTEGTDSFEAYIADLGWAQHFALLNREEMMDRVIECLERFTDSPVERVEEVSCHHSFTQVEVHLGQAVWLSRKGAIAAERGHLGLIPGSMGTASYVVEGLGNPDAFRSAPHGAGRACSRGEAKRRFTLEGLRQAMGGIEFRASGGFLDEHPLAYKDVEQVMEDARDLVRIRHTLRQLVNVKGE